MTSPGHEKMNNSGLRIGRHYSPGGKNCLEAVPQILREPASAFQMFAGNPHRYWASNMDERQDIVTRFHELTGHMWSIVHMCYINNFAADDEDEKERRSFNMSIHSVVNQLQWAELMGFNALVVHPGSPKDRPLADGLDQTIKAVREALVRYEGPVDLLLENAASTKKIGGRFSDLVTVCNAIGDERLGITVDTTHAFASGSSIDEMIEDVKNFPHLVRCIHLNTPDKGVALGNCIDRHSSTFEDGIFSKRELQRLFLAFHELPLILEGTPDLHEDLTWMLRWELDYRTNGDQYTPEPEPNKLGDIFDLQNS